LIDAANDAPCWHGGVNEGEIRTAIRERIMKTDLDARVELNKQVAAQERRAGQAPEEDAARETNAWRRPFDWWDFVLIMMPIATVVLTMWWDAPW
jgi:hypothetical protein